MENNPIKYSDLIQPDDSIKQLISQLEELGKVYDGLSDKVKKEAAEMVAGMKSVSGATEDGRKTISSSASEAQKMIELETRLTEARGRNAEELARLREQLRQANIETKNRARVLESEEGSYNRLAAEYNLVKQQLNAMSKEQREAERGAGGLVEKAAQLYAEMKKLQEETGKHVLNVGNYADATKNLKKELKDMLAEMAQLERDGQRGSERYKELARSAGSLQNNISDARAEMKRYASDTMLLNDAVDIVTTATTAWQVYQGAVNAFGIESEEAQKAMAKLQGILSITNGLQQLATKFTDNSTATYKIYHKVLRLVGLEKKAESAAEVANTAAKGANTTATATNTVATEANTVAVNATTVSMTGATVAAKALRVALMTIGIGILVAALGALVAYWDDVVAFFKDWSSGADETAKMMDEVNEATAEASKEYAKARAEMTVYEDRIKSFNGTKEQERQLVAELNQKYGTTMGQYKSLAEWKVQLANRGEAYCQVLLKEAEAQAILNKYIEAYQELQSIKNKSSKDFEPWLKPLFGVNGEKIKQQAQTEAQQTADAWMVEYKKKMSEADALRSKWGFTATGIGRTSLGSGGGVGGGRRTGRSGGGTSTDPKKQAEEEAKRQEQQYKEALKIKRAYEDAQLQLESDEWEKRRKQTIYQYERQIEDLKHQLATEKNLTEEERQNINGTIEALSQKEIDTLSDIWDEQNKEFEEKQKKQSEIYKQYLDKRNETQYEARTREIKTEIETIEALLMAIRTGMASATVEEIQGLEQRVEALTAEAREITRKAVRDITSDALDVLKGIRIDWSDPMDATQQMTEAILDLRDAFNGGNLQDKIIATAETFNILTSAISSATQAQEQAAQKAMESAQKQVEAAKTALNAELEARNAGYANNVELAQKELDMARKNQEKARRDQERAQKASAAVQTVQQIGNLVTASSLIWSQLGFPLAIPAIAVMWGSFAAAKLKAASMAKSSNTEEYGQGTVELLQGGSHQSGNDIDLGRKADGTRRRAEGGEFFAIINRRSSRRYRKLIPDVINSINDGTFIDRYGNIYPQVGMAVQSQTDISALSEDVHAIRKQGDESTYIDASGRRVTKYKNVKRILS